MAINIAELAIIITAKGVEDAKQQLDDLDKSGKKVDDTTKKTSDGGIKHLESSLLKMGARAAGVNGEVARLLPLLLKLGVTGIIVGAGIAAIALVTHSMNAEFNRSQTLIKDFEQHLKNLGGPQENLQAAKIHIIEINNEIERLKNISLFNSPFQRVKDFLADIMALFRALGDALQNWAKEQGGIVGKFLAGIVGAIGKGVSNVAITLTPKTSLDKRLKLADEREEAERQAAQARASAMAADAIIQRQKLQLGNAIQYRTLLGEHHKEYQQAVRDLANIEAEQAKLNALAQGATPQAAEDLARQIRSDADLRLREEDRVNADRVDNLKRRTTEWLDVYSLANSQLEVLQEQFAKALADGNVSLAARLDIQIKSIQDRMKASIQEFGQTLQNAIITAFQEAFDGKHVGNIVEEFAGTILQGLGKMMIEQGVIYKAYGAIMKALTKWLTNPFTAGAAATAIGIALIGLGAALKAQASGGSTGTATAINPAKSLDMTTQTTFDPKNVDRARALQPTQPITVNQTIIGANDPQAQRQIKQMVDNAARRGL